MERLTNCLACKATVFKSIQQTKAMMHESVEVFNFDQCQNCGLVFLNPRVPAQQLGKYYTSYYLPYRGDEAWGKYAHLVASSQKKVDTRRVKTLEKYIPQISNATVLDVGCGKPTFLALLQKKHACRSIGIDFNNEGWENQKNSYSKLELIEADPHQVSGLPEVDAITMWHYLEHDYNPGKTLRRLLEYTHKKSKLIIEVPNYNSSSRKKHHNNWAGFHTPRHTALYTPQTMQHLLHNNGWKLIKSYSYGTLDPFTLEWMSAKEQEGIDWSQSMESQFINYVKGMILFSPKSIFQKRRSLGFMTAIAIPA